ncbi:MAG TPA: carboxymuconolactone decarboxylase family protein [Candidatus Sulfotelmatobacter sp.]|nr:carboxymuconolactone decarboxylase family protein [Candidatus Sulfotelmatobacter sp.]
MKLHATMLAIFVFVFTAVFASAQTQAGSSAPVDSASSLPDSQQIKIVRAGSQPASTGPEEHFTGSVRVEPLFSAHDPARAYGGIVTVEAGARTAWHTHVLGQTLIVTDGTGWIQQWGGQKQEIRKGDVVWIPAGQKHWHGATASTRMSHIAIAEQLNGKGVEWMEKVSEEQYDNSKSTSKGVTGMTKEPSAAQKLIGDIDPKLAELTDNVLFGDVWQRPGLAKRDRSLITVAALIAMNRPEQLRSHIRLARENGVTQEEIVETITHLAFYSGWPNAINAVGVAREVFENKK